MSRNTPLLKERHSAAQPFPLSSYGAMWGSIKNKKIENSKQLGWAENLTAIELKTEYFIFHYFY